ncbi:MAG: hypothetical protein HY673_26945 [Chloroflexi bacterium]|nr:hypothetical protein [Chloroflexota bacterium]
MGQFYVMVTLEGEKYNKRRLRMLVDTGATYTHIAENIARDLGKILQI